MPGLEIYTRPENICHQIRIRARRQPQPAASLVFLPTLTQTAAQYQQLNTLHVSVEHAGAGWHALKGDMFDGVREQQAGFTTVPDRPPRLISSIDANRL
ncbi:hypothetical protein CBM2608_B30179 [Cupriavidus taiwanensis]|nr:hypothetical protein CBM2608_B30179 [Cupriavidus taiwanensis]